MTEKVEAEQELKKTKATMEGKDVKQALQQQVNEMDKAMERMQLEYAAWRKQVDEATKTSHRVRTALWARSTARCRAIVAAAAEDAVRSGAIDPTSSL